jgi:hypothetical protein
MEGNRGIETIRHVYSEQDTREQGGLCELKQGFNTLRPK